MMLDGVINPFGLECQKKDGLDQENFMNLKIENQTDIEWATTVANRLSFLIAQTVACTINILRP